MASIKQINVVVGIILDQNQQILLSTRPRGKSYEGYWEFAGGKIEAGETHLAALARELHEELNIHVEKASCWLTKIQEYSAARIHLHFFKVTKWSADIQAREGQLISWQNPSALTVSPVLVANTSIVKSLCLPEQFTGSLETGLTGRAYQNTVHFVPEHLANTQDNIIINTEKLAGYLKKKTLPFTERQWISARIQNLKDWLACYRLGIDVVIFSVLDYQDISSLLVHLKKGMPTPLIIDNPNKLDLTEILSQYHCNLILS